MRLFLFIITLQFEFTLILGDLDHHKIYCPPTYNKIGGIVGKCFHLSDDYVGDVDDAIQYCREWSKGTLYEPHSKREISKVVDYFTPKYFNYPAWIGYAFIQYTISHSHILLGSASWQSILMPNDLWDESSKNQSSCAQIRGLHNGIVDLACTFEKAKALCQVKL
ncbi:uncharacterized protein LOC142348587 isoform X2 [Convolutriloba macropyga]|uniref:uncharacterized protein LOC142348587 isoform X2 n=1 Tax=Convolutriloba macropyga TaxID=536237 RepID=UPI003F51EBED